MTDMHVAPAPPVTLVIFGATGDLTRRLLVPALINMTRLGLVGDDFHVLGVGIEEQDAAALRTALGSFQAEAGGEGAGVKGEAWERLAPRIDYLAGDFTGDAVYVELAARIGSGNVAFYLAVPPRFFGDIVDKLADHGLTTEGEGAFRRVAIEKPFGHDLASARALNARILGKVPESQIYRLDHFLGKETVQNIMTLRFANRFVETMWNAESVDHIQITAAETVDVGTRGAFYDPTGALRDMVPNHLFQLLAMVAMEPPNSFDAEAIRDEKGKLLKAVRVYDRDTAATAGVRGVYEAGEVNGHAVTAYRDTKGVAADSRTETFVALKLMVDTWRWAGVPFYLRTGKAMAARDTEVVVTFKPVPFAQFPGIASVKLPPNRLVIQIQPNEGISMEMAIKQPGMEVTPVPISLDFRYADHFQIAALTGYETLLYDLFVGDQTLFQRADAIEAGWAAVQPFLDLWGDGSTPEPYAPGSMGPEEATGLMMRDGRAWHAIAVPVAV
jgi:glucose-6-phosphate 1-dehydrogenase